MLTLENVRKSYGSVVAVDGLTMTVRRGEVLGLLGPNGAGKSTTIHMAVGLLTPDSGRVTVSRAGSPTTPGVRRLLGVAPQALALYELLTAEENLRFLGEMYDLRNGALEERVDWALQFVGLADRRRDRLGALSGGMRRRLNLAAALVHDPELVLLDEPTAGVDPQSRHHIFTNILALKALGRTVIYTTHYMEEAERLCDRVAIIDGGRLLALGSIPELLALHGVKRRMVWRGATLEEVFLQLTGRQSRD